jgi:hypothetical protein
VAGLGAPIYDDAYLQNEVVGVRENRIHMEVVPRKHPDLGLYMQALVDLARQIQAAEDQKARAETGEVAIKTPPAGDAS